MARCDSLKISLGAWQAAVQLAGVKTAFAVCQRMACSGEKAESEEYIRSDRRDAARRVVHGQ